MCQIKIDDMTALAEYRSSLRTHPKLIYLFFELTDACNLSCLHCGSSCAPGNRRYLSTEIVKKVLREVADAYPPQGTMICLSGGEPLLHPDFYEIAAYAVSLGFSCGVTTNATLINEAVAIRIAEAGIQSVTVSLDGTKLAHNFLRNNSAAFRRTCRGIRNLVKHRQGKFTVQTTTVVHNLNIVILENMYRLMQELHVDSWRLVNIEPIGRALENDGLFLSSEDHLRLLQFIQEKRFDPKAPMEVTYGCSHYLTPPFERMVRDNYFMCGSGIYVASILANGDIYSCMDIQRRPELVQGNVYKEDFVPVWENRFQVFRQDRSELCGECRSCEDRLFCAGDSAHTWDYDRNEPLLCMKKVLGKEQTNHVLQK